MASSPGKLRDQMGKEFHGGGGSINNNDQIFGVHRTRPRLLQLPALGGKQDEEHRVSGSEKQLQPPESKVVRQGWKPGEMCATSFKKPS